MAELNPSNLAKSALSGYQLGEQMKRRKTQDKRDAQRWEWKKEAHERERQKMRRAEALRKLKAAQAAQRAGNTELATEQLQDGLSDLDMDVEDVSPQTTQALDTLKTGLESPGSVDERKLVEAANTAFRGAIEKGVGSTVERDGKKVKITDKRITEVAPAPQKDGEGSPIEPGIMARMEVTGKTEGGETVTWRAPLTQDRTSNEDDPAQGVSMDGIARQVVGRKKMIEGLSNAPEFASILQMAKARAGGDPQQREKWRTVRGETLGLEGGLFKQNVNTGDVVKILGPDETGAGSDGGSGGDSLSASYYNAAMRGVENALATKNDEYGNPIVPKERRKYMRQATALAHRLLRRTGGSISPGEAADMAVSRVMDSAPTMPKHEARAQAAEEFDARYDTGASDFTGDTDLQDGNTPDGLTEDEWIEQRAAEIRARSAPNASGDAPATGGQAGLSDAPQPSAQPEVGRQGGGQQGQQQRDGLANAEGGQSGDAKQGGGLSIGDTQTDGQGNTYRYTGGNPNNPDSWEKVE